MNMRHDNYRAGRIATTLEEIDRELARLARLCRLPLLQRGVVERVLRSDATVYGDEQPARIREAARPADAALRRAREGSRGTGPTRDRCHRVLRGRAPREVLPGTRRRLAAGVRRVSGSSTGVLPGCAAQSDQFSRRALPPDAEKDRLRTRRPVRAAAPHRPAGCAAGAPWRVPAVRSRLRRSRAQ